MRVRERGVDAAFIIVNSTLSTTNLNIHTYKCVDVRVRVAHEAHPTATDGDVFCGNSGRPYGPVTKFARRPSRSGAPRHANFPPSTGLLPVRKRVTCTTVRVTVPVRRCTRVLLPDRGRCARNTRRYGAAAAVNETSRSQVPHLRGRLLLPGSGSSRLCRFGS